MTKAELIKKFEEKRDDAEKNSLWENGILSAAYQEAADIWAEAINLASQLDDPKSEEPPAKKARKIELSRKDGLWYSEIWEESSPGVWAKAWESDTSWRDVSGAAVRARQKLDEMP